MLCIPKHLISKFKEAAMNGEVDLQKLYDMKSSEERRIYFTKFTNPELGKFINTEFEKAIASKKRSALTDFVKGTLNPKAIEKPVYKSMLDKINSLSDAELLTPNSERGILQDLISDKLGVSVTPEQIEGIKVRAEKIQEAQKVLGADIGDVLTKFNENLKFFEAKKQMDDHLKSLSPAPKLRVLTGTIGRGMMLFSFKSPILNIGSNTEVGITEALVRRLSSGTINGTDNKLAIDYVKKVNKIYQKTGYDISRAESLNDLGVSGERVLGETVHSGGSGEIRRAGRVIEDIVFKQLMGAPDVAFSSVHFADSVNLASLKMAKGNKVLARKMMEDSMRLKPQTPEGEILRNQGILDAQVATWTNESWASKTSEGIRRILNERTGDARLGDYLLPFIKTPANVIATGMDYAGLGIPKAMVEIVKGIRAGDLGSRERMTGITRDLVRSGLGMTAAAIIAANLKDDDFVGAYDPSRKQIEELRGSNFNAIRIGNKWISTDWLGPLSVPVTSMMYAKKYGKKGMGEMAFQYSKGVVSQVEQLPGIRDVVGAAKTAFKKDQTLQESANATSDYIVREASSRLMPSAISDFAKGTDKYERKTSGGVEAVKAKIPMLRESLPIKTNIFGEKEKTESFASTVLMGGRLSTSTETPLIKEINRVSTASDKNIKFTDWDRSGSNVLQQFKEKVGEEKFNQAKIEYGQLLKKDLESLISKTAYKKLNDEEKYKVISGKDSDAMESIFKKYHFKYKAPKSKKINL